MSLFRRFSYKLTLCYLALFIIVFSVSGILISKKLETQAVSQLKIFLEDETFMAGRVIGPLLDKPAEVLEREIMELSKRTRIRLTLIQPDGVVAAESHRYYRNLVQIENHLTRPEVQAALVNGKGEAERFSDTLQQPMVYSAQAILDKNSRPLAVIRGALPLDSVRKTVLSVRLTTAAVSVTGFLIVFVIVLFLGRHLRTRVRAIAQIAENYGKKEPGEALAESMGDDEFDLLAGTINKLANSLNSRYSEIDGEKKKLKMILDNMVEGVIAIDRYHRVVMINKSACEIFGARDEESSLYRSLLEITYNSDIDDMAVECIKKRSVVTREIDIDHPETKILQVNAIGVSTTQGDLHSILVVHDISQIRKLENLRREFVANVSHELRTPLTSITGFVETLLSGAQEDPEKREHFLKIIQDDAARLNRLIQDILDISKLESKETVMKIRPAAVDPLIRNVLEMMQGQIQAKNLTVEYTIQDKLLVAAADEDKLKQVFINLIDNAIKFNKESGKLYVRVEKHNAQQIRFEVEDTGLGIPQDKLPRIFERFFRVDKGRSRQLGGTGLGLSIVKHIIEAHHGEITCESRVNRGTKFVFYLPTGEKLFR